MKNVTYINAGAGSGKTYTLTRILSEKLSDPNSGIQPSQIILTTFTELAASEFREKARQKVIEADNLQAAAQIDSAAIGTVHSVALSFIKKFWYLLNYGANIQTITERDEDFYMSQSLARIVSERDANGNLIKQKELNAFRNLRDYYDICDGYGHPDYHYWQQYLKDIVEKMEYYGVDDVQKSIDKNIETIETIFYGAAVDYDFIAEALEEYGNFCLTKTKKADDPGDKGSKGAARLKNMKRDHNWLLEVKELMSKPCSPATAAKECSKYSAFISILQGSSISTSNKDIMIPFIESIFPLAKEWRDDYVAYKERKHLISYNDMERLFLHLITHEQEVIDYVKNSYKLVMVDEFQDSNPIQLKIFNRLSEIIAEGGGHSYWVGDPKQAIYGFRGADTDLVNSVSKHFKFYDDDKIHKEEGTNNLGSGRLIESWRSRAPLVNLVNEVFKDKFAEEIDPLCITLEPHFKDDDLGSSPLIHWANKPKDGRQKKVQPEVIAAYVKDLLDSRIMVHPEEQDKPAAPIRPKDIAILSRKNEACSEIIKAMREYNIPVSESESNIMQRIEVQLVVSLLQFIQNPSNRHIIADLMRLLWDKTTTEILQDRINYVWEKTEKGEFKHFDVNGKFIDEWEASDKTIIDELLKLTELTNRFKHLSIPDMVRAIIYECNLPALTARWGDQRVRQQNLSTIQHLADDYDQMCLQMGLGTSISGFIYYLNSTEPDTEKDNQSNTVKVFTYHGSKGLQWPVVVLNELDTDTLEVGTLIKKSFMKVREVVLCNNDSVQDPFDKKYYIHLFPNIVKGSNGKPEKPMEDIIQTLTLFQDIQARTRSEEKRLLYVGMTRAKDFLYTTAIENSSFKWLTNIGITNPKDDHVWGLDEFTNIVETKENIREQPDKITEKYSMTIKPSKHAPLAGRYLSPSKLVQFQGFTKHLEWAEQGIDMATNGWGQDYAIIGSCIHDIFAAYKKGADDDNRSAAINTIGGYGLTDKLSGHEDAIIRSADWLYDILQRHFPQKDGDKTEQELPFMMTLPDCSTLRGEMDLLWHYTDDNGEHCILIDYKTYRGVDLNAHSKTYYAQLSAYKAALENAGYDVTHTLIYYPVHCKVHELTF